MPQLDFDGANSKISADKIQGQSGTTVTVQSGHNLAGSGSGLTALNGSNISTGTVADARISALTASKLTGALPAISGASLTNLPSTLSVKVGKFTKDISDSTASQAITGVGFTPVGLFLTGTRISTTGNFSCIAFGTTSLIQGITQTTSGNWIHADSRFRLYADASNSRGCYIASFDADGFTLTWDAKSGTPTGTMQLNYCAIR